MLCKGQIELVRVQKAYGSTVVVDDLSLLVEPAQFLTLLGASGSGKTTTLMMIAGFESPTKGAVLVNGTNVTAVPPNQRNLGVVFQHYALFPHMTIRDNLAFPLHIRSMPASKIKQRVAWALDLVSLENFGRRYPSQLSGGQQQRVALARALIYDPPVLLMDEPLGALDKKLREQLQLEIKRIQKDLDITIIYVTHDQDEALTMSDRIAIMRKGRIAQVGSPEDLYENPVDDFVADFLGEMNFVPGTIVGDASPARGGRFAIRPERILISDAPRVEPGVQWVSGVVQDAIYYGAARRYLIRIGDVTISAKQQAVSAVRFYEAGSPIHVGWATEDLKAFA